MKLKITLFATAVALVAVPQAAAAPGPKDPGAKLAKYLAHAECKAERRAMGKAGFQAEYGAHPRRACMEAKADEAAAAVAAAVDECKANAEAPAGQPGGQGRARAALMRCVRAKMRAALAEARGEVRNAAQECKKEREAGRDAFRDKYGTNANKANAFGMCVSSKAGDGEGEETEETPAGGGEGGTPPAP